VLDGIDARRDGVRDGFRALGMDRHLPSWSMRRCHHGPELLRGELGLARVVGDDPSAYARLDHVRALGDESLDEAGQVGGRGRHGLASKHAVARAARDSDSSPGCHHARPGEAAVADRIAEKEVGMSGRTEVADSGEPSQEGGARRLGPCDLVRRPLRGISRLPRQVRVRVDEPGHGARVAEVDDLRTGRNVERLAWGRPP